MVIFGVNIIITCIIQKDINKKDGIPIGFHLQEKDPINIFPNLLLSAKRNTNIRPYSYISEYQ